MAYRRRGRRVLRLDILLKRIIQLVCVLLAVFLVILYVRKLFAPINVPDAQATPLPTAAPTLAPTPIPTLAPTVAPDPTQEATAAPAPALDAGTQDSSQSASRYPFGELPESAKVDDSYFDDAVFVGDSIMQGLYYDVTNKRQKDAEYLGTAQFLTAPSYSVYHAVELGKDVAHPAYRGRVQPVPISIRDMGAKKVYFLLGMNDIFIYGVMKTLDNYDLLLTMLRAEVPDAEIYILSVIPCTRNAINKNSKIDAGAIKFFDQRLPKFCEEHDCYYIDISGPYIDEDGYLKSELSSDDYVHIAVGKFDPWIDILRTHTAIIQ